MRMRGHQSPMVTRGKRNPQSQKWINISKRAKGCEHNIHGRSRGR